MVTDSNCKCVLPSTVLSLTCIPQKTWIYRLNWCQRNNNWQCAWKLKYHFRVLKMGCRYLWVNQKAVRDGYKGKKYGHSLKLYKKVLPPTDLQLWPAHLQRIGLYMDWTEAGEIITNSVHESLRIILDTENGMWIFMSKLEGYMSLTDPMWKGMKLTQKRICILFPHIFECK